MTEQKYRFANLDTHAAIVIQMAIEKRKDLLTLPKTDLMQKGDKAVKAVVEELDQMYDDLDRHIAETVRQQEYKAQADHFPPELT